jgi:O-antigen/teichoic acid export membrane protein
VLSTAFIASSVWAAILAGALIALSGYVSVLLFDTDGRQKLVVIATAAVPLAVLTGFLQDVMRLSHQALKYVAIGFVGGVLNVAMALYLVVGLDLGLEGLYWAGVGTGIATLLAAYRFTRASFRRVFDTRELRVMLAYGLPLVPVAATAWVLQFADRLFLLHYVSLHDLGLYGLGTRLSYLLLFVIGAFSLAWSPFVLDLYARDPASEPNVRARALRYLVVILCFGAVSITVLAREFFRTITPPTFEGAYEVVGLLSAAAVAQGFAAVAMTGITLARRTMYFTRYALYTAVLNVAANFLLIPSLGIIGAATSVLITQTVLAFLYYHRAQALAPAPFAGRQLLKIVAFAAVLGAAGTMFTLSPVWLSVLVKLPLILAFGVAAWALHWVESPWGASMLPGSFPESDR